MDGEYFNYVKSILSGSTLSNMTVAATTLPINISYRFIVNIYILYVWLIWWARAPVCVSVPVSSSDTAAMSSYLWYLIYPESGYWVECGASDTVDDDDDPINVKDDTHRDQIPVYCSSITSAAQLLLLCLKCTLMPGQIGYLSSCSSAHIGAQKQGNHWEHLSQYRCCWSSTINSKW